MYNVEEVYINTIKENGAVFKKLCDYTETQIKKIIAGGNFALQLKLEQKTYPSQDISRLIDYLRYLGYKVESFELTNDVTSLTIQWTEDEVKKFIDNK